MPFERDLPTFFDKSALLLDAYPDAVYTIAYTKHDATRSTVTARVQHDAAGLCLKFRTDKVLELGRLMVGGSQLSQRLAQIDDAAWEAQLAALQPQADASTAPDAEMKDAAAESAAGDASAASKKKKKKKGKK